MPDGATFGADELPWRASSLSARFRSGYTCSASPAALIESTDDIRATVGLSPVGDWAGANADRPAPRSLNLPSLLRDRGLLGPLRWQVRQERRP